MIGEIDKKLNQLEQATSDAVNQEAGNIQFDTMQQTGEQPIEVTTDNSVFVDQEQPIQVAGWSKGIEELVKGTLKETLQAPGARVSREIKTVKPKKEVLKVDIPQEPIAAPTIVPPKPKKLKLSPEQEVQDIANRRQQIISEGAPAVSPVPTEAQIVSGVQEG